MNKWINKEIKTKLEPRLLAFCSFHLTKEVLHLKIFWNFMSLSLVFTTIFPKDSAETQWCQILNCFVAEFCAHRVRALILLFYKKARISSINIFISVAYIRSPFHFNTFSECSLANSFKLMCGHDTEATLISCLLNGQKRHTY